MQKLNFSHIVRAIHLANWINEIILAKSPIRKGRNSLKLKYKQIYDRKQNYQTDISLYITGYFLI